MFGCKWLNVDNSEFDSNIEKLKDYKMVQSIILGNVKKNSIPIIPLYHP